MNGADRLMTVKRSRVCIFVYICVSIRDPPCSGGRSNEADYVMPTVE